MKSLWAGITNLIDPTRQSFMIFLFTFESCDRGRGGGGWYSTKIYHKAQPPHPVSTTSSCSQQMTLLSFFTCKNPLKLPQKSGVKLPLQETTFQWLTCEITPFFRYDSAGTAGWKKNPKTWKKGWAYWQYLVRPRPWDLLSITHFSKKQDVVSLAAVCVHMSHVWPYFLSTPWFYKNKPLECI